MIQPRRRLDALAVAMLIVLSALWGVNQVAVKLAGADIPPLLQGAIRSAGSGLAVLLWALASGDNLFRRDGTLAQGILVGLLFGGEVLTLFLGIQLASASHTVRSSASAWPSPMPWTSPVGRN
jgi:drug/metabolite transporter (DMT)-like permease